MLAKMGFELRDGIYALSHDVINPKADRRYARMFEAATVWKKGLLIRVKRNEYETNMMPIIRACANQNLIGDLVCDDSNNGWRELQEAATDPPVTTQTALALLEMKGSSWIDPSDLLDFLLEKGAITMHQLLQVGSSLEHKSEEELAQWRKDKGR
jgi:hypothetical protein